MTIIHGAAILTIERGIERRCRQTVSPSYAGVTEVTAELGSLGRLLLFCDLNDQTNDADNHKTELKQFRICKHEHHPLSLEGAKKSPPGWRGQPPTVAGSAKARIPHPLTKGEKDPHAVRDLTIPYRAVILKIGKGAAKTRSALNYDFEVIAVLVRVPAVTSFYWPS